MALCKDRLKIVLPENVCDAHVHIGKFSALHYQFYISDLEREMEKYSIAHCLVFTNEVLTNENSKRGLTEQIIKAGKSNPRLHCLFRSEIGDYLDDGYMRYAENLLKEGEALGIKINPSTERVRVTESIYEKPLALCNDYGALVLIHCGRWVEMSGWVFALDVARKYPKATVILAHMGGTHPDLAIPAIDDAKKLKNVLFDTSQTRQLSVLRYGLEQLGADRLLFASDMPWGNYLQNIVGMLQLDLDESDMHKVLRGNFHKLLDR